MPGKKGILAPKQENAPEAVGISLSDSLLKENDSLLNLYTHTDNSINSIFNFYVTLLTTITGAIIVLIQISQPAKENLAWTILALLVLIILFGVITQDFLIYKDAELAHFTVAINSLKDYLFQNYPDVSQQVFFLSSPYSHINVIVSPVSGPITWLNRFEKFFWWMLPLGMPQLFVSFMTSLALTTAFVLIMVFLLSFTPIIQLILASIFVLLFAYIAQCTYANLKFKGLISHGHVSINGKVHPWFQNPIIAREVARKPDRSAKNT